MLSFATDPDSPTPSTREGSSEPSKPDRDTPILSADAASFQAEDKSLLTTDIWASPAGNTTSKPIGIAFLDLDFFGLEKDIKYGM